MSALHANSSGRLPTWWGQRFNALGESRHTFKVELGLTQPLVTRDEGNIKAMLATQIDDWRLGAVRGNLLKKFLGASLFTLEGHLWKQSRSFARSTFSRETISKFSKFERHVQNFFEKIPLEADGWTKVFDLQPLFF